MTGPFDRPMDRYDFVVVGAGIVGLATALALRARYPDSSLLVMDKEVVVASHQSGRNSGVIHSGVYYTPGSLKARLATAGSAAMLAFCREHNVACEVCGKLIVAVENHEMPALKELYRRGRANGVPVRWLGAGELREVEPEVRAVAGIRIASTGIVDFAQAARAMAGILEQRGARIALNTALTGIRRERDQLVLVTASGEYRAGFLINCAGLHSDRIATLAGARPEARIVPFRGEYYDLKPERRGLVRHLIYPVPDPRFPFLGVHFTRAIDGRVHAGPNAVLSWKREGYEKRAVDPRDSWDVVRFSGFWRFAGRYWREGLGEYARSLSRRRFVASLQRLVPAVRETDLVPAGAGVRAQALRPDGRLVDDFLIVSGERSVHVCNAPSPAATASIAIGQTLVERIGRQIHEQTGSVAHEGLCHGS